MGKLLIIKTGASGESIKKVYGDHDERIIKKTGLNREKVAVVPVYKGHRPYLPDNVSSVIVTGSPSMVTDREPWSVETSDFIKEISHKNIPILGICYGHQLLADAFGGEVGYHKLGKESGKVDIKLSGVASMDPLLGSMPKSFKAYAFHEQTVTKLPANAKVLAGNGFEKNHAVAYRDNVWGVQFHPEFNENENGETHGEALLKRFVQIAG